MTTRDCPTGLERLPLRKTVLHPGTFRYSGIELLAVLALLFLSAPFIEDLPNGDLIEAGLISGVMVSSVLAVGGRRRALTIALLLLAPALGGKWVNHFWPSTPSALVYLFAATAFFVFVVSNLIRFILRAPQVDANVLCAGLSGYLLLGLLWAPAYMMISRLTPAAFNLSAAPGGAPTLNGFDAFYFSFMTLCTVGYGDITPVSKGARMLAVIEAITGLFYVAVLISRLVAIYSSSQPTAPPEDSGKGG
jgi:hypothetical protein